MNIAHFTNYSNEDFTAYWDGVAHTFKPGQTKAMPEYLAEHFSKHLANRELIRMGRDMDTSPKRPQDVPAFMEEFGKAFSDSGEQEETVFEGDSAEVQMDVAEAQEEEFSGKPKKAVRKKAA